MHDSRGNSHTNLAIEDMVRNKNSIPLLGNEFIFGVKLPFIEPKVDIKLQNDFSGGCSNFYSFIRGCLFISLVVVIVAALITYNSISSIFVGFSKLSNSRKYIKADMLFLISDLRILVLNANRLISQLL